MTEFAWKNHQCVHVHVNATVLKLDSTVGCEMHRTNAISSVRNWI